MVSLPPSRKNYPLWMHGGESAVVQAAAQPLPKGQSIVTAPVDRWETQVSRRPLPPHVESILISGLDGDLCDQHRLFDNMIDDWPKLSNNMTTLKRGAASAPYAVHPWTDGDGNTNAEAEARKKLVEQALWGMRPDEKSLEIGAEGLFEFLAEGTIYGHSVIEILWESRQVPGGMEAIMPRAVAQVDPLYFAWPDTTSVTIRDRLMMRRKRGGELMDFPDNKFIVQIDRAHRDHPSVASRMRALTKYWLGGKYGWEWLLVYAQLFGSPFRWATYDPSDTNVKASVCNMLANMGNSGWGAFPTGTELKFEEVSKSGGELPQTLVQEIADIAADILVLGHTQQTKQNAGSRATEVARAGVRKETLKAVCSRVAATLTQQFARYVCFLNYGNYDYIPEIRCDLPDADVTQDEVNAFNTLQQMGVELTTGFIHDRYGIPVPTEKDKVLKRMESAIKPSPQQAVKAIQAADNSAEQIPGLQEIYDIVMQSAFAYSKEALKP